MDGLDKMARELLADAVGAEWPVEAESIRGGDGYEGPELAAIRTALLTAPPGYVMVPVEPTGDLTLRIAEALKGSEQLGWPWEECSPIEVEGWIGLANAAISAMLDAAPEVK